jgi:hypothetical protein
MADENDATNGDDEKDDEKIDSARRRLLRSVVYVPPAVIGIVSLTQGCAPPASCAPVNCGPNGGCHPNCMPNKCNPHP